MKKNFYLPSALLSFLLFLFLTSAVNAQIYEGDLLLEYQSQIDTFNYTTVTGDLTIHESSEGDITNLNGLSELTFAGALDINGNAALTDLTGLSGLTTVESRFSIKNNHALENLDGLTSLDSAGNISISTNPVLSNINTLSNIQHLYRINLEKNDALSNIDGLSNLSSVYYLFVSECNSLINLDPLSNLTWIGRQLHIRENNSLMNIDGLSNVTTVSGDAINGDGLDVALIIWDNSSLTSIKGLSGITHFSGVFNEVYPASISIKGNNALRDFDGFTNLTEIEGHIQITDNDVLENLDGLSNLEIVTGTIFINDNDSLKNIDSFSSLSRWGTLNIINNPSLNSLNGLAGHDSLYSLSLENNPLISNLDVFGTVTTAKNISISGPGINDIKGLSNLSSVHGALTIFGTSLRSLDGLENLTEVGFRFYLANNHFLQNLDALSELSLGFNAEIYHTGDDYLYYLFVDNNDSLRNLDGLSGASVAEVDPNLKSPVIIIEGNDLLTDLCGIKHMVYHYKDEFGVAQTNVWMGYNGYDPTPEEYFEQGKCAQPNEYEGNMYITSQAQIDTFSYVAVNGHLCIYESIEGDITNLDGLSELESVGSLRIVMNSALTNLDSLSNLSSVGKLEILDNSSLTEFCGLYPLASSGTISGDYIVTGNASNPTKQDIIDAGACPEPGSGSTLTDVNNLEGVPDEFALAQNYPNPFNPTTAIKYDLPEAAFVKLTVYNSLGQVVHTLVNENKNAGTYEAVFNASGLSSGIYFYRIEAGNFVQTNKLILMK